MIYQKLPDNTFERFGGGKITNGTKTISASLGTAREWAEKDIIRLNAWGLFDLVLRDIRPTHDPDTEVLVGPTITISETEVVREWIKLAKTDEQKAEEKTDEVAGINRLDFEIYYNFDKRIRTLKRLAGQTAPALTKAEFKEGLEAFAGKQT